MFSGFPESKRAKSLTDGFVNMRRRWLPADVVPSGDGVVPKRKRKR